MNIKRHLNCVNLSGRPDQSLASCPTLVTALSDSTPEYRMDVETIDISVILTIRNGGEVLQQTLDSIASQTGCTLEVIIVDDGSTDNSLRIAREWAETLTNASVHPLPPVGRGTALNYALGLASNELLANFDSDDPSHPGRLATQAEAMRLHPEVAVCFGDALLIGGLTEPEWGTLPARSGFIDVTNMLRTHNPVVHSCVMIRANALRMVGGYDGDRTSLFDYDLWCRLAENDARIARIPLVMGAHRIHPGQSFEHSGPRLRYRIDAAKLRFRHLHRIGAKPLWYLKAVIGVVGAFAPPFIREKLRPSYRP